jgi:AraC-like DNA-binding protein
MDILLSSGMPAKVLRDLTNLGIKAEIDKGASLEKSVQRARRESSILMVPLRQKYFEPEVLRRAPGVIALGKKAFDRAGLAGSVAAILRGFYAEQYLNHISILHGSGPSQAVFRTYENLAMQEGITIPRGSNEQFLHFGKAGVEELHRVGILLAGFSRTGRGYFVERRPAEFNILGVVLKGALEVHADTQQARSLPPGSSFLLPSGFRGFYRASRPVEFLWFHVDGQGFGLKTALPFCWTDAARTPSLVSTARQFLEESRTPESDRSLVLLRLGQLLALHLRRLVRGFGIDPQIEFGREKLRLALRQVETEIAKGWSVPALARAAGLSVSKLYRETHTHYRKRPGALIEEVRIRHASELLAHFDHKLQQVAAMTGYADPFSFSRAFKRVMGMSPSDYRSQAHEKKSLPANRAGD